MQASTGRPAPSRPLLGWLVLAAAAVLLLPWYGLEHPLRAVFEGQAQARPVLWQGLAGGRAWLLPLLVLPVLGLWAAWRRQPRLLVTAALLGLGWMVGEALAVTLHGWGYGWLTALFGPGPKQAALGWGALAYALAGVALLAQGLARLGWLRGDAFVLGAILGLAAALVVFVGWPVSVVLVSAVRDNNGAFAPEMLAAKLFDRTIWGLDCLAGGRSCGVAWNTLALALIVGVLSTLLGLATALLALRTRFPAKGLLRILSLLPVITPPFVIGLALILMFGRGGFITTFLAVHFDIPRSRWLYGLPGVAIAQVLAFTPIAFLVLAGLVQGVAPSMEEAAQTLRASRWHVFRTVTWPLIRPGLANAFLVAFIESLADFGNPLVLGGNYNVLSTDIFFAVVGAAHDQGRAAVLALVLLAFTLGAFVVQQRWVGEAGYTTVTGKGEGGISPPLPGWLGAACYGTVLPWLGFTVVVYAIILAGGFVADIGRDNTPSLQYFWTAFSVERGVGGWFLSGSGWSSLITTMELALVAMPITAALGILAAWLLARQRFAGRGVFEVLAMMSFAIPGTVIGVSYILAFNVPPLELTGTAAILVLSFVFRNMPVGIRAGLASLGQIDRSLDEASLTLRANSLRTLRLVILPILRPAIIAALVYSFVRAVTAVSAVIFLTTAQYNLATVYIVGRAEIGEYGLALVYSAVLILVMVGVLVAIRAVVGEQALGRRNMMGQP